MHLLPGLPFRGNIKYHSRNPLTTPSNDVASYLILSKRMYIWGSDVQYKSEISLLINNVAKSSGRTLLWPIPNCALDNSTHAVLTCPCYMSTHLNPFNNTSLYISYPLGPDGIVNIGAIVNICFNFWKLLSHLSLHSHLVFFINKCVNSVAITENPSTKHLKYSARPKKFRISITVIGFGHFITASIFVGSTEIPSLEITCPRNATRLSQNSHLLNLAYSTFSLKVCKTLPKWTSCSSGLFEYTNISSIKTMTNWSKNSLNTLFMKSMNTAGAFVNPNGITVNS